MPDWLRDLALAVGGCMEFGSPDSGPAGVRVIYSGPMGERDAWLVQVSPGEGEPRINLKKLLGVLDRTDDAYNLSRRAASVMLHGLKGDFGVVITVHLDPDKDKGGEYMPIR